LEGSGELADRQQSQVVQTASATVLPALMLSGGALVVLATVALIAIVSVAFLITGGAGSAYDQIGAGGIDREGEYDVAPAAAGDSPAGRAERELEIRQLLSARSERLVRSGQPPLDVDAEVARLLAAEQAGEASDRPDPELMAEVRSLVVGRNERRVRQGMEPLDVDAEVKRALEQLGP
jgi:hypothetical protein